MRRYIIISVIMILLAAVFGIAYGFGTISFSEEQTISSQSPMSFVVRSHSQLMLNNRPFRFAGANMHWLALNDTGNYTPHFEVMDGLATARAMGLTVIRSHSLGISVGCLNCIEPRLGVFNQTAFNYVDYAIKVAKEYNMYLIIPLTDNYHYTTGGKHTFTEWRGISNENEFYTNSQVINDFEVYINTLLNHVNLYTGIKYKDDPTIMAWETGNEIDPPINWTQQISTYIKNTDQKHLVIDGREGVDPHAATLTNVDITSNHYYPMNIKQLMSDAQAAQKAQKAFLVGEFQWNDAYGGNSLDSFLASIMSNHTISGSLFWELWPHSDSYGFISNEAKFTLHYPGDTSLMQMQVNLLRTYAFKLRDQIVPVEQVLTEPWLSTVIRMNSQNVLIWRGAVGAVNYSIERSTTGPHGPWIDICNRCATDANAPWIDSSPPSSSTWYQVIPYTITGVAQTPSNVYQARSAELRIDDLDNWSNVYGHSNNLSFNTANPNYMNGDSSVVARTTSTHEYIIWQGNKITSFQAITYFWPNEPVDNFSIYVSTDGVSWKLTRPDICKLNTNWFEYIYSLSDLSNTNYVKVVWNNLQGNAWSPQLGTVSIS